MLEKSVIGSVLLLALAAAVASITLALRVQNARVADQKEASERLEKTHTKMVEAFGKFKGTLESLEKSEATSQQVLTSLGREVSGLSGRVDLMIAINGQQRGGGT
jgi:hypothetical protein